jgi:hypothetical protein
MWLLICLLNLSNFPNLTYPEIRYNRLLISLDVVASVQGGIRIINRVFKPEYTDTNSAGYFEITQVIIIAVWTSHLCSFIVYKKRTANTSYSIYK